MITPITTTNFNKKNQQVAFKGGRLNVIKYAINPWKRVSTHSLFQKLRVNADVLELEKSKGFENPIFTINNPFNRHKSGFLYRLATKFQTESFCEQNAAIVDKKRQLVYDIFHNVKFPDRVHKFIADSPSYTLEETKQILDLMNENKHKKQLATKLLGLFKGTVFSGLPGKELIEILQSDNCKILNRNFSKAESFILKQNENENFTVSLVPELLETFAKSLK